MTTITKSLLRKKSEVRMQNAEVKKESIHDNFFIEEPPLTRIMKKEFGEIIAKVIFRSERPKNSLFVIDIRTNRLLYEFRANWPVSQALVY